MRIIILSLLIALANMGLYAQDAMPDKTLALDLNCVDCDLSVKIITAANPRWFKIGTTRSRLIILLIRCLKIHFVKVHFTRLINQHYL